VTIPKWSQGSNWLRWDPHLHTPGTLQNNQFGKDWDGYLKKIEEARPAPSALGITDYFTIRGYKEFFRRRQLGVLTSIPLIFPNIELRLTIETKDRQGINLHLLVCPDDPDHVSRIEEMLARLSFRYRENLYPCSDDGLIRLGRAHRGEAALADESALQEGSNQFKVEWSEVRSLFEDDSWVQGNVLVAVAAGNDGLAGISKDASFSAQREELGRFAHIVFSGQPNERTYWLGQHPDFEANAQTLKPCLHGCDAHTLEKILKPDHDRYCWIRGEPSFDSLRQTLVEPERRVHIGETPPQGPHAGDTIRTFRLRNASWIDNQELRLNDGLVTIIGAKGSGKTALADLLAFAADADETEPGPASFIAKAQELLGGLEAEIEWRDGTKQSSTLPRGLWNVLAPRVRYLSQQFVERLCSPAGLAEPLMEEIERVVFNAIPEEDRLQCSTFAELREVVLETPIAEREAEREAIRAKTKLIAEEIGLQGAIPTFKSRVQEAERNREGIEKELQAIPVKSGNEKIHAHQTIMLELQSLRDAIASEERQSQALRDVQAEVQRQSRSIEDAFQKLRAKHEGLLDSKTWELLKPRFADNALITLARLQQESQARVAVLREHGEPVLTLNARIAADSAPRMGLAALSAESVRLTKELGLDQAKATRRITLQQQLAVAKTSEDKARKDLAHAEKSKERKKEAQVERLTRYEKVFEALISEEQALERLYARFHERVVNDVRLSKLAFIVERVVDIQRGRSGEKISWICESPHSTIEACSPRLQKISYYCLGSMAHPQRSILR
jgi:hypothetical protein